jgi:hypothetical protein
MGHQLHKTLQDTNIHRLNSYWSDHSILEIKFIVGQSPSGPGLWRANPAYANHAVLHDQIKQKITQVMYSFSLGETLTAAQKWDRIKKATKKVIKSYSFKYSNWRKDTIRHLEKKRNRILRSRPSEAIKSQLIPPIDLQLGALQQELTDIAALKAGIRWREQGEKSAGFFKRMHHNREVQQHMMAFKKFTIGNNTVNIEAISSDDRTADPTTMREIVHDYYQQLYTTDKVEPDSIQSYLKTINTENKVDENDNKRLLAKITLYDILEQVKRSPKQSSPGEDGLGYQYLQVLFNIPDLKELLLELFNDALSHGRTPDSWKEIRVRLLPKKGDLTELKNWRPISLINCDAKIFTRILNDRMTRVASKIIQQTQTGFMNGRFIGDNGLLIHLITQQARYHQYSGIGLLLDQEKAYDRVNPVYLCQVLGHFGFHKNFIHCLSNLFFGNQVQINVNGFFSPTVNQQRGLRQGDPLSPILFNLALEPLLSAINQDSRINGYQFEYEAEKYNIKAIAYADDICTLLSTQEEYQVLKYHLNQYSLVSNAKFNQRKTEAFAINGQKDHQWQTILNDDSILTYHTRHSVEPFRYLGFYITYTIAQRNFIQEKLLTKIKSAIRLYSTRNLSLRGRVTITNTLILTKIWYCLRLLQPTQEFLKSIQSLVYGFVWQKKVPLVAFDQMCLPINRGGLGVIHPLFHLMNLQVRHLRLLFRKNQSKKIVAKLLLYHMSLIAGQNSCPLLSFVVPVLRNHSLNHPTSIILSMYKAFDRFDFHLDYGIMSLENILHLPLSYLLQNVPTDNWIHRHKTFPANKFFYYDVTRQRLRILVEGEYTLLPRLCKKLKSQILLERTVQLKPFLLSYVLQTTSPQTHSQVDTSLVDNFIKATRWKKYQASEYRNYHMTTLKYPTMLISKISWLIFWSTEMLLQARAVWYRVLSNKIPTTAYLAQIKTVDNPQCRLCRKNNDDLEHFLVSCPSKQDIWLDIITRYLSEYQLDLTMVYMILRFLQFPKQIRRSDRDRVYTIFSTTLWNLWIFYWKFIIDKVPFQIDIILSKINSQIITLLDCPALD